MLSSHLNQLHYAFGKPVATATIRQYPEDFKVTEQLSFDPSGEGQHSFLFIEKRDINTDDVAKQLARFADVKQVAIGYAGLKDKHAVTRQWFSVDLAGKPEPDWQILNSDNLKVIEAARHSRKLKRGSINSNQFQITLREIDGDPGDLNQRLELIRQHGVPNYFGEQRFGRNDANLKQAEKLFLQRDDVRRKKRVSRHLRSLYLSAVRAFLFNLVLSQRVADKTWNQPVNGDVFMLEGSHSVFTVDNIDDEIVRRVNGFDIHPTGPLWGSGMTMTASAALNTENKVLERHQSLCRLLETMNLNQQRRMLRINIRDLHWEWAGNCLVVQFGLPSGCYATSLLRELAFLPQQ